MALKHINAIYGRLRAAAGRASCRSSRNRSSGNRAGKVSVLLRLAVAMAVSHIPSPVLGQTEPAGTNSLSLANARQLALERNWDLLAARSGIDAAQAQFLVTKEFPNPTVSLSTAKIGDRESGTVSGNGLWARNYDSIA